MKVTEKIKSMSITTTTVLVKAVEALVGFLVIKLIEPIFNRIYKYFWGDKDGEG